MIYVISIIFLFFLFVIWHTLKEPKESSRTFFARVSASLFSTLFSFLVAYYFRDTLFEIFDKGALQLESSCSTNIEKSGGWACDITISNKHKGSLSDANFSIKIEEKDIAKLVQCSEKLPNGLSIISTTNEICIFKITIDGYQSIKHTIFISGDPIEKPKIKMEN